jgi:hypothetical protein
MLRQLGHFQTFLTITPGEMYDKDVVVKLMEHDKFRSPKHEIQPYTEFYDNLPNGSKSERAELKQICRDLLRKHSSLMIRLYSRKKIHIVKQILPSIFPGVCGYMANDKFGAKGLPHTHACLQLAEFPEYV